MKKRGSVMAKAVCLALLSSAAGFASAETISYAYRFEAPQKVTETAARAVSDRDPKTIAHWKGHVGSVVCELPGSTELEAVEVTVRKVTNWYLMTEVEVALDDGTGEFGSPRAVKVDIPKYGGKPPVVDASCTNMSYRIPVSGCAARVRVNVKSEACGAIAGISVFGKGASEPAAAAKPVTAEKPEEEPSNLVTVENRNFRLKVTPLGGRAYSLYSKFLDAELTDPRIKAGTFSEFDWSKRPNKWFFLEKPFILKPFDGKGEKGLTASGNFRGGGTDFLVVNKRYTISDDSTALKVDYRFENLTDAMSALDYSLLIHTTLGINGRLCSYYYPTEEGIVEIERDKRPLDRWFHHPSRGWMAAVDDLGRGIAVTMPFKEVKSFYSWYAKDVVPTLEWRMIPVSIDCGKSYEVPTEVIAFKGLKRVSGAGGGLVGEIADGTVTVFSSRAGKVVAKADGKTVELAFAKMGTVKSFKTDAATVILEKDGKEVCRLEAPPKSGAWALAALEQSRVSSVKSFDLTCYTNFPHQVCQPFAKPLAVKRRPRIAAFTGLGDNIELGFFADRFDCELLTSSVALDYYVRLPKARQIQNPIYDNGDYFGSLSTADVEENIVKTLKKDIDAILVGGLPWEIFPKDIRKLILEKVKSGVGLVWIGQDRAAPEIGCVGEAKRIAKQIPSAVTPEFADVPFALLGAEPFSAFKTDGVVHAAADGNAWLVEQALGKGKVFHLAYEAIFGNLNNETGITPNLRDYYPDRVAPVEYYYSLIAKCLAKAAKVELPVSFAKADVNGERAALKVVSAAACEATAECVVRTRFGEAIAKGRKTLSLRAGENAVELPLAALRPYAGALACEVVLRDGAGRVLNWGAWAFEKRPSAALAEFSAGKSAPGRTGWREGDTVPFVATVKGGTAGRNVRFRVADSYGRLLQERTMPASAKVEDKFVIANELPARMYEVTASLMEGDREIDRLRAEVRVRPDPVKWPWDDFFFGFWTGERLREYLWPEFAKLFRTMHATANIANQWRMAVDFPSRYGFDPTLLSGAGLGQCGEPPDYVKTGDKMKLLRKPCLSDPAFFAKQDKDLGGVAKRIADLGLRYVWFGDEQSLTGYGGKPIDFCFSEHCLKEFRVFLKDCYGTLEKLNAAWETSFADWNAVIPFTRQEVWAEGGERHVAGWADHLEFMDGRLANSLDYAGKLLKSGDPNIATSVSGTQAPTAYGGMDWWKQVKVLDGALSYFVGGQLELHRSFRPDGQFMPWNWGYSARGAKAIDNVWRTLFVGCRGVIGFHDLSIFNPDWTWSAGYKEVKPCMDRIASGVGKHLIHNLKGEPSVAVLYSQASIRAAFFENRREEHSQLRDKYIRLLHHLGYAFDFVSYEQLADGTFESRGYKALILADATAMSDAEVAAVERFAAKGGAVLAEGVPAVREGNCRKRVQSPLARFVLIPKVDVSYLKALEYPAEPENAKRIAAEQDRLESALAKAGVNPPRLLLSDASGGGRFRLAETYARAGKGALFWGVISNDRQDHVIDFSFPKKGHLCDLAAGKYIGFGDRFTLPFAAGRPYAFELMDERPAISGLTAEDGKIRIAYSKDVDSVVYLRIYDPKGQEVEHYSRKLVVKNGVAETTVPFALSDPKDAWRVTATDVFGGEAKPVSFNRQ